MNTMDELIKALECCELGSIYGKCESCPYTGIGNCNVEIQEDALHYLKKYREEYKALIKAINEAIDVEMKYYHMIEELERNSPLTWDELQEMEDKPVWIQEGDHGYWIIIDNFSITSYGYHWLNSAEGCLEKEYMGISWQAYRKEKE